MYGKKPLIAILSALVLTGCGGGGSKDESSTGTIPHTTSKNSIASSTSGGDAQDEAAYKKLKSYVEFLDDGEHNPGYRSWSRYYFPVDYFE
ncbi:MAG: hypothetical protein LBG21_03860, partial [Campylobacteraceae bacterium]|nr:hypothetical protein [Campylobacteraceae bacterium]